MQKIFSLTCGLHTVSQNGQGLHRARLRVTCVDVPVMKNHIGG